MLHVFGCVCWGVSCILEMQKAAYYLKACSQIIRLRCLLKDFEIHSLPLISLYADNPSAIHIASNPIYHERTKQIEVDCHSNHDLYQGGNFTLPHVASNMQLAYIFTKNVTRSRHLFLVNKLILMQHQFEAL